MKNEKKKKANRSSGFIRKFLLAFIFILSASFIKLGISYSEVKKDLADISIKIDEEKARKLELEEEKVYFNSDAYIEKMAREQLGMIKSNEVLYINSNN